MAHETPFSRAEAEAIFARIVAGWADRLDDTGARIYLDGVTAQYDAGGSYEGVTRMFWALGGWLSYPDRPSRLEWRGKRYDLIGLMRRAVLAGTDPDCRGYWGVPRVDQLALVESAHVAFALWQTRARLWDTLTRLEQDQIVRWLDASSQPPESFTNNFALFWLLNHGSRQALGERFDDALIDRIFAYLDGAYCGNGWYDDGPTRGADHFDDYTLWVFASHTLCWCQLEPESRAAQAEIHLQRVRELMQHVPYFYGADGAYAVYGRSISYKFARLGAPLWAQRAGVWPHPPGMLRRLVGQHLRWNLDHGVLRADGTLVQGLTSDGSVEVRETYGSTGAPYWAMQAFGGLWSLPDDDPFWTDPEVPLPVGQGDFVRAFPEPGWVVTGSKRSGQVQRYSARSAKYPAKYGKFCYSSLNPFNVGLVNGRPSPDSMLCLIDDGEIGHRDATLASVVGDGWLRMRYAQEIGGASHKIETAIVIRGESHVRVHRIDLAEGAGPISAVEGSAPLGFPGGGIVESGRSRDQLRSWASHGDRLVAIRAIRGYDRAGFPAAWGGNDGTNSVYGKHLLPHLIVDRIEPGMILACIATSGMASDPRPEADDPIEFDWADDGEINVQWGATRFSVPPLDR
jgi:hypothetical protein